MASTPPPPGPPQSGPPPSAATPATPVPPIAAPKGQVVPRTRTAIAWSGLALGGVALVLVIIFILQNLNSTRATFLAAHWTIPLGIDLLLAALLGALVTFLLGAVRMLQLRRLARRYARQHRH